jgi:hypothetical protein
MKKIIQFTLLLLILISANVIAQQDGLPLGSFTLFPTLGLSYGHSDNIFLTSDRGDRQSSNYTVFSPSLRLETEGDKTNFLAQYDYNRTSYNSNSRFDFEMHHLLASLGYNYSNRSDFRVSAEYFDGSDRIGTANQQGNFLELGLEPDEWHSYGSAGKWHYGGVGAKGSIDIELGGINREYDNNRFLKASRDRDTRYMGITYTHQITPKTNFLTQYKYTDIDYDSASLDNTESRLLFGAEWQVTGKTNVRALVGYLQKDFDDPIHDDFNGTAVEAGMTWSPRSYSIFDLTLTRETDETNGNGSYIVRNSADLGWTHFWKDRFSTTTSVGFSDEDYKGSFRNDELKYYGVAAKYQFNNWLMSGIGYKHYDRSSSIREFAYRDNSVLLTLELSK